jgi:hypothetical protein
MMRAPTSPWLRISHFQFHALSFRSALVFPDQGGRNSNRLSVRQKRKPPAIAPFSAAYEKFSISPKNSESKSSIGEDGSAKTLASEGGDARGEPPNLVTLHW